MNAKEFYETNKPTILAGVGIVSLWIAVGTAFKSGSEAKRIIEDHQKDLELCDPDDKEAKKAVTKEFVRDIIPSVAAPIIFGAIATGCITKSNSESAERLATATAACSFFESRYRDYRDKLHAKDPQMAKEVRDEMTKDQIGDSCPDEMIEHTGNGSVLCFDEYSGRYYYSCAEAIGQAIVRVSYRIQSEMWVSLNEFYIEQGLKPVKMGDDLGWNVDNTDRGRVPIFYSSMLTDDNVPCLVVQYDVEMREKCY